MCARKRYQMAKQMGRRSFSSSFRSSARTAPQIMPMITRMIIPTALEDCVMTIPVKYGAKHFDTLKGAESNESHPASTQ
jgi:hypothetical protein